ncbi:hypothetical protein L1987_28527 [Smallanthus sonchifolius]|uniref:Uncharacterized protein n=1 Tax=Smallanthus sonchifolius TaxID=185202 RepID=A0ACB9HY93_9ASTR|nr:hypothetical protein L1987_28527 [Smallanthus sonchifolius]
MRSRNKKKRRRLCTIWFGGIPNKKRRKPSSTYKRRTFKPVMFKGELKDMRKLCGNDEAFHLFPGEIRAVIDVIHSRKTPTHNTYMYWNEYAISFYLKMCTCFGADYQHLEATPDEKPLLPSKEQEMNMECTQLSTKEISYEDCLQKEEHMVCTDMTQPSTKEMSYEELLEEIENTPTTSWWGIHWGPFKFGSYSCGTTPDRIPYHLYLLVKEAVDIMISNTDDLIDLTMVERKIQFFCNYFHSHLPTGWNYDRDNASSLIAGYDTTGKPRYLMAGYTPIDRVAAVGLDEGTQLTPQEMLDIMRIIHSRKTPSF